MNNMTKMNRAGALVLALGLMTVSAGIVRAEMAANAAAGISISGWQDKWPDGKPSGASFGGTMGNYVVKGTAKESYGSVWKKMTVDLTQTPILSIDVSNVNGFWFMIVKNQKIKQGYVKVQPDTNVTGKQAFDLRSITGLSGRQEMEIDLGVSSGKAEPNLGKTVTFKDVKLESPVSAAAAGIVTVPGAMRASPWMNKWPDNSPTGASATEENGQVKVVGNSAKLPYGVVKRIVSVDLDRNPVLKITPVSASNLWYLEAMGGNIKQPVKIQPDTADVSPQMYNLKEVLGLAGEQSFELLIGVASGTEEANNGKEAVFKDLSFVPQAQ
jgi:hypothetical protein